MQVVIRVPTDAEMFHFSNKPQREKRLAKANEISKQQRDNSQRSIELCIKMEQELKQLKIQEGEKSDKLKQMVSVTWSCSRW